MKKLNSVKSGRITLPIHSLREPYEDELDRLRLDEFSKESRNFAFHLESLERGNKANARFNAPTYQQYTKETNSYYSRYVVDKKSSSLGLILTNIDLSRIQVDKKKQPVFFQIGPQRRKLAMAQRALFFEENQCKETYIEINNLENGKGNIPHRSNKRSATVDEALGIRSRSQSVYTPAIQEIGYKKISSERTLSRREIIKTGLFNIVGKYPRKILGLGSMPPVSGWRDVLVMSMIGHMICFIPRSSIYAFDTEKRINLGLEVVKTIKSLKLPKSWEKRVLRNLGAALGAENPEFEVKIAKRFHDEVGINSFRIYTIGSDKRIVETSKLLRKTFGNKAEIFVGQIADHKQAKALRSSNIRVDGLIFGHGGGQQCTSAINGMAITTLEDVYSITLDKSFNNTSILVEGGIGRSIGTALILGVDCSLCNQKFVRGTMEAGELYVQDKRGKICQPYPGTASPVTQIIESEDKLLRKRRTDSAGRTYYAEGKPGFMYYEEKANSMAFWVSEYMRHATRTLADLDSKNIRELRNYLVKSKSENLRIMSENTQYLSKPHWNM